MATIKIAFDSEQAARHLRGHRLFHGLAPQVLDDLLHPFRAARARAGQFLFREGDEAHDYLLVDQGRVEVLRFGLNGEERIFHIFEPGELVAEAAMFMPHGRYPMYARAQSDAVVGRLSRLSLQRACESHSALAMRMLAGLSQRLYHRVNDVDWLIASTAAQRLAAHLLRLQSEQGAAIQLPSSQRHLAARLGIRAETLNRLFAQWLEGGYLSGRGRRWVITDQDYLRTLASAAVRAF